VLNLSPFSVASTSVRVKILTWFFLRLSSLAHPHPVLRALQAHQALRTPLVLRAFQIAPLDLLALLALVLLAPEED
jgi:hypothetical protein